MIRPVATILSCALLLAACGSSSPPHPRGSSSAARALKFAQCMRSHGVPKFPDPGVAGSFNGGGANAASPAFKTAQTACLPLLTNGVTGSSKPSAAGRAMLAVSKCMRSHGVPDFPDPTTVRPFGAQSVVESNGVYLWIPVSINTNSPAYKRAAKACHGVPPNGP